MDRPTALLGAAQDPDGYLQTYYQVARPGLRWQELDWGHELHCAGHLIQAAVAHHRSTGGLELLAIAERFAAHIDSVLGTDRRVDGVCGHALQRIPRRGGARREQLAVCQPAPGPGGVRGPPRRPVRGRPMGLPLPELRPYTPRS
ncbi:beta-L-arabinofuranosidase domain-containing protein [Streptomyces sp. NPDC056227]|uniref:beta-L-arabinofuranosidase domain-containing protein n=1 Tax=Streptomyces sp. NPDC056227 TaxID=3345753 RepID=UPI0035DA98B0